jgi:hypothetical protein
MKMEKQSPSRWQESFLNDLKLETILLSLCANHAAEFFAENNTLPSWSLFADPV